jgi:protein-S-isoprenylcysteine O-methyltransferase Ste14
LVCPHRLALVLGILLFTAAGTARYWQGWTYLALFFATASLTTPYLMKKDPALLARWMRGGPTAEKERTQRIIMLFPSVGFIVLLVVPGLDRRFGWSAVPVSVVLRGVLLVAVGFYIVFAVYKENTFHVGND